MRPLPAELQTLSRNQAGLLTAQQLSQAGFRRRDVDLRIARQEWQRISETVVAVHAQEISRMARLWAASLHFERCGLAGTSALELLGMAPPHDLRIHMIGPRAGWYPPQTGVVAHSSNACAFPFDQPLRVGTELAVLQAMRWAVSSRQAVFHATWAIQRGHVALETLQQTAKCLQRSPGTAVMRKRLSLLDPGVHSVNEFDFAQQCRNRGLPEPERQRRRLDSEGRDRYTDVEFCINGRRIVVEIDGMQHLDAQVHIDDQWRANEIVIQGTPVLRIPALALRLDPDHFFEQLRRALRQMRAAA